MSIFNQHLCAFLSLLALLGMTIWAAFLPIGQAQLPMALLISSAKAALIAFVFMRLPKATGIAKLAFATGLLWLLILAALSLSDYLTRN